MIGQRDDGDCFAFSLVMIANLLPLVGYAALDWGLDTVVRLYCIDATALFVVYGGCAMFAHRKSLLGQREGTLVPVLGGDDDWSDDPRTIALHRSLPPIYPRNLRVVVPSVLFGAFVVFSAGAVVAVDADHTGSGRPTVDPSSFLSGFSEFTSPLLLGAGLLIVSVHVLTVLRTYFPDRRYEEVSAYLTLEVPTRYLLIYLGAFVLYFVLVFLILWTTELVTSVSNAGWIGPVTVLGGFFVTKLVLERGRLRAELSVDPGGFAAWFVPKDPRSEAD